MYATVWPATRDRGDVIARIEVTCHPGAVSAAEPFVYLTIRGRAYAMAEVYRRVTARLDPRRVVHRWQPDPGDYHGGYLDRSGKPVDHRASTWIRPHEIATTTLDRFTADAPDWEHDSVQLLYLREWATARDTVTRLDALLRDAQAEERHLHAALHHTTDPDADGTEAVS